ncbi:hypothetical protein [Lacinutrix mariniflava]|uniref:hypothetical protein n=1 Tax=Lacinutrix mariniflava TaxID=342955 RepID=UPI0006E264F8|nr:hypothetical protein [Lacinutrix mariniflava]
MKTKTTFSILFLFVLFFSCQEKASKKASFYHWKTKAVFSKQYETAINIAQSNAIYLHYFDIESTQKSNWQSDGVFPTYVLQDVAKQYKDFKIIPVVFISNKIFKTKDLNINSLSNRIKTLINQISQKHFNKKITEIQIDCDWTESSKNAYFKLLESLNTEYSINATIRLHQIKFKDKTGVPPVQSGTLMVYNIGDLKDQKQNSILENNIVKQYINPESTYPLKLNIALPLFSQTVVFNNDNQIKLIKDSDRSVLESDFHFKKVDKTNFQVVKDTLYKGFYLSKGYNLKIEELNETEVINSYKTIKDSKLDVNELIIYHLDQNSLSNINLKSMLKQL